MQRRSPYTHATSLGPSPIFMARVLNSGKAQFERSATGRCGGWRHGAWQDGRSMARTTGGRAAGPDGWWGGRMGRMAAWAVGRWICWTVGRTVRYSGADRGLSAQASPPARGPDCGSQIIVQSFAIQDFFMSRSTFGRFLSISSARFDGGVLVMAFQTARLVPGVRGLQLLVTTLIAQLWSGRMVRNAGHQLGVESRGGHITASPENKS